MKVWIPLFVILMMVCAQAQTGPGGIGNATGTSSQPINSLWLNADSITGISDGAGVSSWSDISGNSNDAAQATSNLQPLFIQGGINGMNTVRFDGLDDQGGDFLKVADADNLDNTAGLSIFVAVKPANLDGSPRGLLSKRIDSGIDNSYSQFFFTSDLIQTDIDSSNNRIVAPKTFKNDSLYLVETVYDGSLVLDSRTNIYINGIWNVTAPENSAMIPNYTSDLDIGTLPNISGGYTLGADIPEVVIYQSAVNPAQRVILENYFSAKYDIPVATDVYAGDTPANGDFDNTVIGIGKTSDLSHTVAQGGGLVINNNAFLDDNGDYVLAGHNAGSNGYTTSDVGSPVLRRWSRIWYVDRTDGGIRTNGNITIGFDYSDSKIGETIPGPISYFRLLYRSSTTGNFSVVTTANATISGDQVLFDLTDSNLLDGEYTLGLLDFPPTVANPIADVTVDEDAPNTNINLFDVFTDIDNDPDLITKTVLSNTNLTLVTASIVGNTLTLDYQPDVSGTANITIRGTSNGQTVDDQFTVDVNAVDDPPTVANPIADVPVNEDAPNTTIDLSNVFTDVDNNPSLITKTVQANDNTTLVTATISGNTLTLDYQANQNGTAHITIRGTSNGKTVDDQFTVTVAAVDDPPTVANPIADVPVDEDAANTTINLANVFTDVDNDPAAIVKTVQANDNTTLVAATISGNTLTLDYQANQNGTAHITIRGTSNGKTVDDQFTVTVAAVDDAPTVANAIADVSVDEDAPNTTINLANVFTDIDNDPAAIVKTVQANDNTTLVAATISGNTLTLNYQANQSGTAHITIRGTSNGKTVDDQFTVNVAAVDDPPTVANPIADVPVNEDAANTTIDLTNVFTDTDNNPAQIVKTVQANDNTTLVAATISGNTLTLDYQPDQNGTAHITIRGTSNGKTVDDQFTVNVAAVDDPPVVANPIGDVTVDEDAPNTTIDLTNVFNDVDNNPAQIVKTVQANDNTTLVAATISGNTLTLDYQPNQNGSAHITIRATSNGKTVDDQFTVNVSTIDDPPTVANPIVDVSVNEDAANTTINLANVFTDTDNDPALIVKTVQANDNATLVTATISGNTLTLDYQPDQNGTAHITIRGNSGGLTVDDQFTVNVAAVDDPPTVANAINDVTVNEDAANTVIDLANVFADVDNAPAQIVKTVQANDNSTVVTSTISGNTLTLDYQLNQSGVAHITIRATSGGKTVDDQFTVTVNAVDDPPVVANPITDVSVLEDADNTEIDLTNVFDDVDNDPALIVKTVQANDNSTMVTATISDNTLTLDYLPDQNGVAHITIRGTSNGKTVDDQFVVSVSALNDPPTVANAIADVSVDEDAADLMIDLSNVFTDTDNDPALIVKTVQANTNDTLVTATIVDNTLTLDFQPDRNGTADITIRGTSGGQTVDDTFTVNVAAVNDAPVITGQDSLQTNEDTQLTLAVTDLQINDPDNTYPDDFTLVVENGENYTVNGSAITPASNFNGRLDVPVFVSDGTDSSEIYNLKVNVVPVNDAPVIAALPPLSFFEDDSLKSDISIVYLFVSDEETPDSLLDYQYRNGKHVFATLVSDVVTLKAETDWNGLDTLWVIVSDGVSADSAQLYVTVKPKNDAPVFVDLPDSLDFINTASLDIDMNDYVDDPDLNMPGDHLTFEFEVSNDSLMLNFNSETGILSVTTSDFIGFASLHITVTDDSMASVESSLVIEAKADPLGLISLRNGIPDHYSLSQNYPNPFNPVTKIPFGLPKAGDVELTIYNVLGQKVVDLLKNFQTAGYHVYEFDASQLPSGIYFYRLSTSDYTNVKKMILLK